MLSTDHILKIVEQKTAALSPPVQSLRDELLDRWRDWSDQGEFCTFAKTQIDQLHRRFRREARNALREIRDAIAIVSIEDAKERERQRQSANNVGREMLMSYELINRKGRGVVYLGSARLKSPHPFYEEARALGREVYQLLGSTSWSGAGPGIMEAPLVGAKEVGGKTAGVKILLTADQTSFEQNVNPALAEDDVVVCKYFASRKVGLADAAMRDHEEDRTAIITLPGGLGTMDEFFEYDVLKQLKKLGSKYTVPILLMNHQGYYDHLITFLFETCVQHGTITEQELSLFHICRDNFEALEILAETFGIPHDKRTYYERVQPSITLRAAPEHAEISGA